MNREKMPMYYIQQIYYIEGKRLNETKIRFYNISLLDMKTIIQ